MRNRTLSITLFLLFYLIGAKTALADGLIWFPSLVRNGSFEQWKDNEPVGWRNYRGIGTYPTQPFLGRYAVELSNYSPWPAYLYQDISYQEGSFLFGCAHWSYGLSKIVVVYFDSEMQEISRQSWESLLDDWQNILTILRPPDGTATIRIELIPMLDGLDVLTVDHVFMIPLTLLTK